ncbi:MAG: NosL protein [Candidatus Aminicenantes bacterium]|nr:NosL protein [Candidatus Aminicenantes bacterium]
MRQRMSGGKPVFLAAAAACLILAGLAALAAQTVPAPPRPPAMPSEDHKCPVCGMFVAGYKDFLAAAVFRDGATVFFDGCKDMFRFLLDVGAYAPGRAREDIAAVWVTDYYSLKWVDGFTAFFIRGSDVLGPMGRELIPFSKEKEAREFMKDHKGDLLLRFAEVTAAVVKGID